MPSSVVSAARRIISHTCSNTEIVCALGCADRLVGVDSDSDYPATIVGRMPKLGRDLELDVGAVATLRPDLVLTSLTVPGHEKVVEALQAAGLRCLVIAPQDLEGVYDSIHEIADALGVSGAGRRLADEMQAAMPAAPEPDYRPGIAIQWWPNPAIVPGRRSWATDLIERAGGRNPWGDEPHNSLPVDGGDARLAQVDAVAMSWCGVHADKYRPEIVARQSGWSQTPAVRAGRIVPISEAYLGRPGPRLVEGYRALRALVEHSG